jgi:hypothetical protein
VGRLLAEQDVEVPLRTLQRALAPHPRCYAGRRVSVARARRGVRESTSCAGRSVHTFENTDAGPWGAGRVPPPLVAFGKRYGVESPNDERSRFRVKGLFEDEAKEVGTGCLMASPDTREGWFVRRSNRRGRSPCRATTPPARRRGGRSAPRPETRWIVMTRRDPDRAARVPLLIRDQRPMNASRSWVNRSRSVTGAPCGAPG